MPKQVKILLISMLLCVLITAFFRHTLCRILIEKATIRATGLKLSIEDLNLDILGSSLYVRGVTLFNPHGFRNEALGRIKEIFVKYDLWGSLSGRVHLRRVKADISEINIIRNAKTGSNLPTFSKEKLPRESSTQVLSVSAVPKKSERSKKEHPKFLIDSLELSLEKAVFMDYKAGIGEPAVIIFTLKGPCFFKNVSELSYVVDSVSAKGGFKDLLR